MPIQPWRPDPMTLLVLAFGVLVTLAGLFAVAVPNRALRLASLRFQPRMLPAVFVARLGVGLLLVMAAPDTRFPTTLRVGGCLLVAAAAAIPLAGQRRIETARLRILAWANPALVRAGAGAAIAIGGFLAYAVS